MEYEHQIDELVIDAIRKYGSMNPTKIKQLLIKAYNPEISPTTVQKHLDDLTTENILEKSKEKHRNNEVHYSLSTYAERQLEYYGKINPIKSQREGRDRKRPKKELEDKYIEDEIAEDVRIIFLDLLIQAADGSGRFVPASRNLLPGEMELPVSFESEEGVTMQDIVEHRDVGNGRIFGHIKFTMPMVQKCIDVLENEYGIEVEKHTKRYLDTFTTLQEEVTPAGSEPDDLVEMVERKGGINTNEIGIAIKDDNLRCFIDIIACLIFIVQDRIKYTWLFKREPRHNSWEFDWHTTFFGRERSLELIEKSKHTRPSFKDKSNKQKLLDYSRKSIENYWSGIGRGAIDPALIDRDIKEEFKIILHDKKNVDSLLQQTDRRITNLFHERIICDKYERINCNGEHDRDTKCGRCQKFHDEYEEYCKFAKDILVNHNNKSYALMVPLIELVYPMELRKLHETTIKSRKGNERKATTG